MGSKVKTPTAFEANRPDLVVIEHVDKWNLVDFGVPFDPNIVAKEEENVSKDLTAEVCTMNSVKMELMPIVVVERGMVSRTW